MMDYYVKEVTSMPDPAVDIRALEGIPDWRRNYILNYRRQADRKLSLGAWRLMEEALHRYGISARDVTVGASGKLQCAGICFNLSHSGDMVLCAISGAPIGCDIEKAIGAPFEVTERIFTKAEQMYIAKAQTAEEKNRRFFRLWTLKESYVKMTGEGLGLFPRRIEINADTMTVLRDGTVCECALFNTFSGDYEISVSYFP